ncbi:MAG: serine hydrolase domain-containing protein [Duganella sp.]
MNTFLPLAALTLAFVTCAATAAVPDDFTALDSYLQTELRRAGIPGAALVVVADQKIVHLQGYGVSGPKGLQPGADTIFQIGSNTKSFTALAIMQLVEAGKLALDAPVQRYLPWFRIADPHLSAQITLRHLLHQTSGFSHLEGQLDFADNYASADAMERRVRRLASARLASPPGQKFAYSNINSVVLGCVIEAVTGASYASYMKAHVWEPLGMRRTAAGFQAAQHGDAANGYRFWFGKAYPSDAVSYPATLLAVGADRFVGALGGRVRYRHQAAAPPSIGAASQPAAMADDGTDATCCRPVAGRRAAGMDTAHGRLEPERLVTVCA